MELAVLGAVPAVVSIIGDMATCARKLIKFRETVRYAEEDLRLVYLEVQSCKSFASMFTEIMAPIESTVMQMARDSDLDQVIKEQSKTARRQIRRLLRDLKPLRNSSKASTIRKVLVGLTWHNHKEDVKAPLATLLSVKISLNLLTALISHEKTTAQLSQASASDAKTCVRLLKEL
jgi:hypothetical protein